MPLTLRCHLGVMGGGRGGGSRGVVRRMGGEGMGRGDVEGVGEGRAV